MTGKVTIELKDFQENTVDQLLEVMANPDSKQTVIVKSPTGSGKTVILVSFINEFLTNISDNVAFIWFCPGKGDLEEQSRDKMRQYAPYLETKSLSDVLNSGFESCTTTFINWELVTKTKNTALRESEQLNLFDRIREAHRKNLKFIIIVDEEHSNDTNKARKIIEKFEAVHIIRVSATAKKRNDCEYIEVSEDDVIAAELITKALYVNEGLADNTEMDEDYITLLDLADAKRKAIAERYKEYGSNVRPLVLIQFPNAQPNIVEAVEQKLQSMGYTYDNGMVAKWMSEDKKDLPDNLTKNDGQPVFLLMKQAISTGWDCPRAKILVKLRENMSETFTIQTIGRIRRMPEAKHYEDDLLDFCYVYTLDEKYKEGLLGEVDKAYEPKLLHLKEKCKVFTLKKESRDLDYDGLDPHEVMRRIYNGFVSKYKLTNDINDNKRLLSEAGYIFGDKIISRALQGTFVHSETVAESEEYITVTQHIDTHMHGMDLRHSVDAIKTVSGVSYDTVMKVLRRLFRQSKKRKYRLLSLPTKEWWAFVINNYRRLRDEFVSVTSMMSEQTELPLTPKQSDFYMPEEDLFHYDACVKNEIEYLSNAYEKYTSGYATTLVRSLCEVMFEQYCEKQSDIDWVYKNGDSGQQYFSIVFIDSLGNQRLFYPDYIVKKKDGTIWIIEGKGGEYGGEDMNLDPQIGNKFNALKRYAEKYDFHWGFIRAKDASLYINNTVFAEDMSDEHWVPIQDVF